MSTNSVAGLTPQSAARVKQWQTYVRGGFAPFPVVPASASGCIITDVDGKTYIDMIAQFAVLSFGHSHPKLIQAAVDQMQRLPLVNTSYINPLYSELAERITKKYGYDSVTAMCTGAEGVDAACKIARKWAYVHKGIPANQAVILTAASCYHGITLSTMGLSDEMPEHFGQHLPNVGPYAPGTGKLIRFGELDVLRETLAASGATIAAFLVEPVQGSAGTRVPPAGYLAAVQALCRAHQVLFICDEVQTGYGRTGRDLAFQHEPGVRPDLVVLGKAITGGLYPLSLVMGTRAVMDTLSKYEVGSTFAASSVACATALVAMDVLEAEQLSARSDRLGRVFTAAIDAAELPHILEHRGRNRGLFQTLVIDETAAGVTARRIAALCALRGMLCGCSANRLRFTPPLVISEEEVAQAVDILASAFRDVTTLGDFPGSTFIN